MAELNTLLNDVHTNLELKIKELYEAKLKEHTDNISCKLSDAYTKDYGKIDISKCREIQTELHSIQNLMSKKNRYIIHWNYHINKDTRGCDSSRYYYVFDNYGDYITFNIHSTQSFNTNSTYIYTSSKYILPNILIDLVKTFYISSGTDCSSTQMVLLTPSIINWMYYSSHSDRSIKKQSPLAQIKLLAEDYYNRFMIEKPLIEENETLNKSLIKITNEIACQTETFNGDIKVIIENNVLTIFYYNNDELNLCDYLPKLTKDIEKDGRTITINYTNIERVCIICSDFKKITKYYQGIKHIQLFKCKNFERIPNYLKNDLEFFTIDGKNQLENNNPPPYS
jgi:hypothetical protein